MAAAPRLDPGAPRGLRTLRRRRRGTDVGRRRPRADDLLRGGRRSRPGSSRRPATRRSTPPAGLRRGRRRQVRAGPRAHSGRTAGCAACSGAVVLLGVASCGVARLCRARQGAGGGGGRRAAGAQIGRRARRRAALSAPPIQRSNSWRSPASSWRTARDAATCSPCCSAPGRSGSTHRAGEHHRDHGRPRRGLRVGRRDRGGGSPTWRPGSGRARRCGCRARSGSRPWSTPGRPDVAVGTQRRIVRAAPRRRRDAAGAPRVVVSRPAAGRRDADLRPGVRARWRRAAYRCCDGVHGRGPVGERLVLLDPATRKIRWQRTWPMLPQWEPHVLFASAHRIVTSA